MTVTKRKRFWSGWRFGILSGMCAALVVLGFNIVIVVFFNHISSSRAPGATPESTIYQGSCGTTRKYSILMHLVINVLSTVLLGASNYAMQCLIAPTRPEIDRAHVKRVWLDVGVASVRNVRHVGKKRAALWILLLLTSLPLHLL